MDDVDALDSSLKAELCEGIIYIQTEPSLRHQRLVLDFGTEANIYLRKKGDHAKSRPTLTCT